mmetsp:Transcript_10962/g.24789  ORF Transcript_10962/g.24789 Transcript_10962/m.24789 type:complete len:213 (+) Transcript_10962:2533-3171(+)
MMPGLSANCRRTSFTTSCALLPTASMLHAVNRYTSIDPSNPATNTSGMAMSTTSNGFPVKLDTSSMYAEKSRKLARAALPMANPLVVALVVLPTASSRSVMSRTLSGCWLISTIPPALSAMGPNTSMVSTYAAVLSMPIVATAVPNRPAHGLPVSWSVRPDVMPSQYAVMSEMEMTITGIAVLSNPSPSPAMTFVPCPVVDASASCLTGLYL